MSDPQILGPVAHAVDVIVELLRWYWSAIDWSLMAFVLPGIAVVVLLWAFGAACWLLTRRRRAGRGK